MLHVALANIKTYARRYIAAVLAVAIGTAFLGASLAVDTSTRATLKNSVGEVYRNADLVAFQDWKNEDYGTESDKPMTLDVLNSVRKLPEVSTAYGSVRAGTSLRTDKNAFGAWLVPVSAENRFSGLNLIEGRAPTKETEITVDEKGAQEEGLSLGDVVALDGVSGEDGLQEVRIVGLSAPSADPFMGGMMQVGVSEDAFEFLMGEQAQLDELIVNASGDVSAAAQALREELAEQSVKSASVLTADEKIIEDVAQLTGGTDQLTVVLLIFALVALVVTGLVVMNTFSVVIAQRTRELALLRTLGAKRGQIRSSVLIEALLIGVVSSLLGVAAAVGLMAGLIKLLQVTVPDMAYATLALDLKVLLVPLAIGIVMTVLSAWVPARRAMKLAPLAALRPFDAASVKNRAGKLRIVFGAILALAGIAGLVAGAMLKSLPIAFLGGLFSFPGILMLASLFVPSAVYGIGRLVSGGKVAGKLAALNSVRNPGRTTATATALLIGVTLVSMIMVGGQSAKVSLNQGLTEEYPVDLMVQSGDLNPAQETQLRQIEGISAVSRYESGAPKIELDNGTSDESYLFIVDTTTLQDVLQQNAPLPQDGELVYTTGTSGDAKATTATIKGHELKLVTSSASYLPNMITRDTAQRIGLQHEEVMGGALVRLDDSVSDSQVKQVVEQISKTLNVDQALVSGGVTEKAMFSQIIDVLLMIVSGLLAVAVLIALIGVANTLSLSVLERTRENSLLRALGLKKKQLRSMLAVEAVLIGGVAALLGLILGVIYGMFGAYSTLAAVGTVYFDIPWLQLALVLGVSLVAALLASLTPSRRAAKLSPVEGLATE